MMQRREGQKVMSQVLFSKYNSLRRPDFRIVTEIRDQDGEKYVVKRAMEPAAEKHIQRIADNRKLLENYYTDIQVIPVEVKEEGLVFPFVQGISLHEKLIKECSDRDSLIQKALNLLDETLAIRKEHLNSFAKTEEFEKVFGETDLREVPAVCPANIDALFSNFMDCDGSLQCIDYEWVFNFNVPVAFVRYRALRYLHYELERSVFDGMPMAEFLTKCGFSEEEQKCYEQMEYAFQYYVHGEKLKYHYLHRYLKENEKPVEAIEKLEKEIQDKDQHISNITNVICEKDKAIEGKETVIGDLNKAIKESKVHIGNLENTIQAKDEAIQESKVHIGNLENIIKTKEEVIQKSEIHIENLENTIQEENLQIGRLEKDVQTRDAAIHDKDTHIRNLDAMIHDKDVHIGNLDSLLRMKEAQYNEISNAFFWRITKPARVVTNKTKNLLKKNEHVYSSLKFGKRVLRCGPKRALAIQKTEKLQMARIRNAACKLSEEETEQQRNYTFDRKIRFSILVPLYNTPEKYLSAMIDSVLDQTYAGWELCLADGSDAEHVYVGEICRKYAKKDKRILYKKLKKNGGISENTNACIDMATGDYIGLFDHDDLLHPYALFEYMKVICEKDADFIYSDENTFHETPADAYWPHYKPDFAPDTLRSYNYICHFSVFSKELLEKAGGYFRKEFDGSQDYDLILRLTEKAKCIVHVPKVLYFWRSHEQSTASDISAKPYTMTAARAALAEHLQRVGLKGTVSDSVIPSTYKIQYQIEGNPMISIVIPNKDHIDDLSKCLNSIREKSTWKNWEIVVVENNSTEPSTFDYYQEIEKDERIHVVKWKREFNFSAINNFGVRFAKGEHILLLNNDVEIITPDWLEQMLMFVQRSDVGAAGAMLYYPDDTVQHAGVILGIGGVAGHSHKYFKRGEYGYASRMTIAQDLSGVTAACVMMPRKVWDEIDGLDEGFAVAFNDVDLCMRIRKAGYLIVWTPYAELYHYESKSRGLEDNPEKQKRFKGEIDRFMEKWGKELADGDPYYNPNLTLVSEDFSFR